VTESLGWQGRVFNISALSGDGCDALVQALMTRIEALRLERSQIKQDETWDPLAGGGQ